MKLFPGKSYKRRPVSIAIQRFVNLTMSLADKVEIANNNMGRYTIFINKKHTLAHIVPKGEDLYIRVPIKAKLLKESDTTVELYMYTRLQPYLLGL